MNSAQRPTEVVISPESGDRRHGISLSAIPLLMVLERYHPLERLPNRGHLPTSPTLRNSAYRSSRCCANRGRRRRREEYRRQPGRCGPYRLDRQSHLRHLGYLRRLGGVRRRIEFNLFRKQRVERNPRRSCDRGPCGAIPCQAAPQVYSNHGGTPASPRLTSSPMFVLVATQARHKYAPASKLYARYPIYSLRLGTNMIQEPQCQNGNQQCYTVFESISPDTTVCPSGSKLNPCQYADGTGKYQYNEFADEISWIHQRRV